MTKNELFLKLWIDHDYCMMGYSYEGLKDSMTVKEIKERLEYENEVR